jgi:hypothetical protein
MAAEIAAVEVECVGAGSAGTPSCPAAGQRKTVQLREAAPGVVELPNLLLCASCGYAMLMVAGWPMVGLN